MALFNLGKRKKETTAPACTCSCGCSTEQTTENINNCCPEVKEGICCVKVLGAGCRSCHEQYEQAKQAVKAMGLDLEVEYITDMEKVMAYGVMSMPALVVNEKVVSMGKILKSADVEKLLSKSETTHFAVLIIARASYTALQSKRVPLLFGDGLSHS